MKFAALALALLLAVGSQAASLQADAPSPLDHIRAAVDVYITQLKEGTKRALDQLDDTEYRDYKVAISQRLDNFHNQFKTWQASVSPVTDGAVKTVADATADIRASIVNDIDVLRNELEPMRERLRLVVNQHMTEYNTALWPILEEMHEKHTANMQAMKTKMEPVMEELREKVAVNVEETKAALMPMVEAVRNKVTERLEHLKAIATPYVDEYKDQVRQAYANAQNINTDELPALREKIAPLAEDIKVKLQAIFEAIASTIMKN